MNREIFTIGHSNHPIEKFIALLCLNKIQVIADVRSAPYSKLYPQYNKDQLQASLKQQGILYVYLGKELGARSLDSSCYVNGKVQFGILAKTSLFRSGLERVEEGALKYRVALMCAEKDPLECHRNILVAHELNKRSSKISHILADGTVEAYEDTTKRLLDTFGLKLDDMFRTNEDIIEEAYSRQSERIAFVAEEHNGGAWPMHVESTQNGATE
jgi:uncharacterized protein (DUF488 family)